MRAKQLVTSVYAILDIVSRILVDSRASRQEEFVREMGKVRQAAVELRDLIEDAHSPGRLMSTAEADFEALRSRIRAFKGFCAARQPRAALCYRVAHLWCEEPMPQSDRSGSLFRTIS